MRIDILTVLPEMIEGMVNCSIVKRAQDKGLAEIHFTQSAGLHDQQMAACG